MESSAAEAAPGGPAPSPPPADGGTGGPPGTLAGWLGGFQKQAQEAAHVAQQRISQVQVGPGAAAPATPLTPLTPLSLLPPPRRDRGGRCAARSPHLAPPRPSTPTPSPEGHRTAATDTPGTAQGPVDFADLVMKYGGGREANAADGRAAAAGAALLGGGRGAGAGAFGGGFGQAGAWFQQRAQEAGQGAQEAARRAREMASRTAEAATRTAEQALGQAEFEALQQSFQGPPLRAEDPAEVHVTEAVLQFARTLKPSTFLLAAKGVSGGAKEELQLAPWQIKHATLVLERVPSLKQCRFTLCPKKLDDGKFWELYFVMARKYMSPGGAGRAGTAADGRSEPDNPPPAGAGAAGEAPDGASAADEGTEDLEAYLESMLAEAGGAGASSGDSGGSGELIGEEDLEDLDDLIGEIDLSDDDASQLAL